MAISQNLQKRILTALVLIPLVWGIESAGGVFWLGLVVLITLLCALEWHGMTSGKPADGLLFATMLALIATFGMMEEWWLMILTAIVFAGQRFLLRVFGHTLSFWPLVGATYLGVAAVALWHVRGFDEPGHALLLLFLVVWASDIGGYAFGKSIGGPKLAPAISPNKTWSGAIGGTGLALAVAVAFQYGVQGHVSGGLLALVLLLSISSQLGDLLESRVKRHFDVKDSGALLPGHGGLLDRVDGLLAAAIVMWVMMAMILPMVGGTI